MTEFEFLKGYIDALNNAGDVIKVPIYKNKKDLLTILVRGISCFDGYLSDNKNPFVGHLKVLKSDIGIKSIINYVHYFGYSFMISDLGEMC